MLFFDVDDQEGLHDTVTTSSTTGGYNYSWCHNQPVNSARYTGDNNNNNNNNNSNKTKFVTIWGHDIYILEFYIPKVSSFFKLGKILL